MQCVADGFGMEELEKCVYGRMLVVCDVFGVLLRCGSVRFGEVGGSCCLVRLSGQRVLLADAPRRAWSGVCWDVVGVKDSAVDACCEERRMRRWGVVDPCLVLLLEAFVVMMLELLLCGRWWSDQR